MEDQGTINLPRAQSHAHGLVKLNCSAYKPGQKAELQPDSPVSHLPCPDFCDLHETSSSDELTSSGSGELPLIEASDNEALHEQVTEIDQRDVKTPDDWVPRHPSLIRLTGRHPFNCEPPLPMLMDRGFITPCSLHYVRNHGPVPRLGWDHSFSVSGLVDRPRSFTVAELVKLLPTFTLPVTLVCAGNRRREQNIVKKSKGFNWGPSAVSTTYWTGVRLCDLLRFCGVRKPSQGARHVLFSGQEGELPQGKDGTYGTSLRYGVAMDPGCDVMVCFMQNGRLLQPDHGFPVRMIIPGHIGGRMVKWLKYISVAGEESDNFYHFHDNRVLPPNVDQERAKKEGWWFRPEFIINELNINSVITSPAHDETLQLGQALDYTIHGYAYTGGGRMIIRCEVSLDLGKTWRLATIAREEEPTVYGKYWCWVRWSIQVPTVDILRAPELRCRAVDSSNNSQPEGLVWNVMGMMNNPHFRVMIHAAATQQGLAMRFEHPTVSGGEGGGWMEREMGHVSNSTPAESDTGGNVKKALDEAALPSYTMAEVEKHDSRESAWFVHNGRIIDGTKFLEEHPGGAESIVMVAGQDATDEFEAIHSAKAKAQLLEYVIGKLGDTNSVSTDQKLDKQAAQAAAKEGAEQMEGQLTALNPKKKVSFPLTERIQLSHNVFLFRFGLPSEEHALGLPVGQHVFIYAKEKGELVMRAYTPSSSAAARGHFDLVVKVYWANEHPAFPEGGRMSQWLEKLKVGEMAEFKGPLGHFIYKGPGEFLKSGKPGNVRRMSMIAGGTGITPMYQIIQEVCENSEDTVEMKLIFANNKEDDILLRKELEGFAESNPRFQVFFVLTTCPEGWCMGRGHCTKAMFEEHLFPAADDTLALMCGPPVMQDKCVKPFLSELGYKPNNVVTF